MENPFKKYELEPQKRAKPPPHEIAASVDEIVKVVGLNPKYGYAYWLGKVKRSGKSYTEMLGILKEIEGMPSKYSRGGRLTNILCKKNAQDVRKNLTQGSRSTYATPVSKNSTSNLKRRKYEKTLSNI